MNIIWLHIYAWENQLEDKMGMWKNKSLASSQRELQW